MSSPTIPSHRLQLAEVAPRQMGALLRMTPANPIDPKLGHLIDIRASQINGCAFCLDMHWKDAKQLGETDERLYMVAAWREAGCYDARERAAFALTEAITLIADGGVPRCDNALSRRRQGPRRSASASRRGTCCPGLRAGRATAGPSWR